MSVFTDAVARLKTFFNINAYDPTTNPGGFDAGGHSVVLVPSMHDIAAVGEGVADLAVTAAAAADTATTKASEASTSAGQAATAKTAAETARDAAAASAAEAAFAASLDGFGAEPGVVSSSSSGTAGITEAVSRGDHSHDLGEHSHSGATDGGLLDYLGLSVKSEVSITASTTLTSTAFGKMHACTGTAADYPVGLPAASGNAGKLLGIRVSHTCTKLVMLDANGGELIDGATTRVMWGGESAVLLCDGTGWTKIAGRSLPMAVRMQGPDSQSIAASTYTTLALTAAVVNVGSLADTSGSRILVRRAGLYNITGQFSLQSLPTNVVAGFQLLLNGGHLNYGGGGTGLLNGTTPTSGILATCAAGAAVTMRGYHAHTSPLVTGTGTFLSAQEAVTW